ncbi:sirohydrochlorin chelatase [Kitasatospora griseola]|uniref:sirohydrochlorin chelatase n=1 Tax=Kitasatospora griseola TaxID=2064 RepID=UPI0037F2ACA1
MPRSRAHVLAVCGHESAHGAALRRLAGPDTGVVTGGRELARALAARPAGQDVVVVPMTLGRDLELVADAARTVRGLPPGSRRGVAVARPFGTAEHLIGWLRAAATTVPADAALLLTAPAGDPYEDAELYRVARLVRCYGRHRLVETAFVGGDPDPVEGVRRCALLGARRIALLPASFTPVPRPSAIDGVRMLDAGPLLGPAALAAVLAARVADAGRLLRESGDDGVDRAVGAAHGHGLGHTHGPGEGHTHTHLHGPGADHDPHHGSGEDPSHSHSPQAHTHVHSPTPSPHARPVASAGARSHP